MGEARRRKLKDPNYGKVPQAYKKRTVRFSNGISLSSDLFVIGVGGLSEVWQYASVGSFSWCTAQIWGSLQYELDHLNQENFVEQIRQNRQYCGNFAEIAPINLDTFAPGSGLAVGNKPSMTIFDRPDSSLGLSKPAYSLIYPSFPDVLFAHEWLSFNLSNFCQNIQENWQDRWSQFLYLDGQQIPLERLLTIDSLRLSNYPLIVTDSNFILSTLSGSGLIACLIPSLITLVGKTDDNREQNGFLNAIYHWLTSCPKPLIIVEQEWFPFSDLATKPYQFNPDYLKCKQEVFERAKTLCDEINVPFFHFSIDTKNSSSNLLTLISSALDTNVTKE